MKNKIEHIYVTAGDFSHVANRIQEKYPQVSKQPRSWNTFITPRAAHYLFELSTKLIFNTSKSHKRLNSTALFSELQSQRKILNKYGVTALQVQKTGGPYWSDAVTAAMMVRPSLCQYKPMRMLILYNTFKDSGVTVRSPRGELVRYCDEFNVKQFSQDFILAIINR